MTSLFETHFTEQAWPMLAQEFGVTVTLKRGSSVSDSFSANYDRMEDESFEAMTGLPITIVSRMWKFPAASLVIDNEVTSPRSGDVICYGTEEYEVQPIKGRPAVECQLNGFLWLVRTTRVTT